MNRQRRRASRRLVADSELFRRRAKGEPLRAIAADYGVTHTTISRFFAHPESKEELAHTKRLLRAERKAEWEAERLAAVRAAHERAAARAMLRSRPEELTDVGSDEVGYPVDRSGVGARIPTQEPDESTRAPVSPHAVHRRTVPEERWGDPYRNWLDDHDRREPAGRSRTTNDDLAAAAVAGGGGMREILQATGLRTRENVRRLIDPEILQAADANDSAISA